MIYFVTETYLKTNTPVGRSVDVNSITFSMKTNALMWVKPVLGDYFFEQLLTKYNNQTLNADETALVQNYIQPSLAWRVAVDVALNSSLGIHNKGIQKQSGDFSNSVEQRDFGHLSHDLRQKAEFFQSQMLKYLIENKNDFPDLTSPLNKNSQAKLACQCEKPNTYQSGIFFI